MDLLSISCLSPFSFVPRWMWRPACHKTSSLCFLFCWGSACLSRSPLSPLGVPFVCSIYFSASLFLFCSSCLKHMMWIMATGGGETDATVILIHWFSERKNIGGIKESCVQSHYHWGRSIKLSLLLGVESTKRILGIRFLAQWHMTCTTFNTHKSLMRSRTRSQCADKRFE